MKTINKLSLFFIGAVAVIYILSLFVDFTSFLDNAYSQQQQSPPSNISSINISQTTTAPTQTKPPITFDFTATVKNITKPKIFDNTVHIGDNISGSVTYKNDTLDDITMTINHNTFGSLPFNTSFNETGIDNPPGIGKGHTDQLFLEILGSSPFNGVDVSKIDAYFKDPTGKALSYQTNTSNVPNLNIWPEHYLVINGPLHSESSIFAQITSIALAKHGPGFFENFHKLKSFLVEDGKKLENSLETFLLHHIMSKNNNTAASSSPLYEIASDSMTPALHDRLK